MHFKFYCGMHVIFDVCKHMVFDFCLRWYLIWKVVELLIYIINNSMSRTSLAHLY